jgi:hypothetical protein
VHTWPENANRILQYPGRDVRIGFSFAAGLYWMLQIDNGNVTGMMGHFEPNRPITLKEIQDHGISFELGRYCHPYIRDHVLARYFKPQDIEYIKSAYLRDAGDGKVANENKLSPKWPIEWQRSSPCHECGHRPGVTAVPPNLCATSNTWVPLQGSTLSRTT